MATIRRQGDLQSFFESLAFGPRGIQAQVDQVFDRAYFNALGRNAIERIRIRTQVGAQGVRNGRQFPLPRYRTDTIVKRLFLREAGILSNDNTTPYKANNTETGQMFDSIAYTVIRNTVNIHFTNTEAEQKALSLAANRRPFFALTDDDINDYESQAEDLLAARFRTTVRRI